MQQERLFVRPLQRVDVLLVLAGAEGRDHQRLGFAPREQRGAMGARQNADFRYDRAHRFHVAAVDAAAGVENAPADDLRLEFLEGALDPQLVVLGILGALGEEMRHHFGLGGLDGDVAFLFAGDGVGGAQILLDEAEDFLVERLVVGQREVARLVGGGLGETDNGFDHRLKVPVAEHHGTEHRVFG